MGDRYILEIKCPKCLFFDNDVYFAPTCGFTVWNCPSCGHKIDLYEYTGITYEDASNIDLISAEIDKIEKNHVR